MASKKDQENSDWLAFYEEQNNFVKLCGQGDLESVTQLLANDPSLIKATKKCKL